MDDTGEGQGHRGRASHGLIFHVNPSVRLTRIQTLICRDQIIFNAALEASNRPLIWRGC